MSERKVLNKYYPPDFDPSKIPKGKAGRNRTFTVRLMAPCNMKCVTCGEYIGQGKKFNARKEDVEDMNYLGLRIYRFYIRCPGCISEISFRTDPVTTDYVLEAGAHRNFQALKKAEAQAEKEAQQAQDEIESNPMLLLENRTQQSQREMDSAEGLEELREINDRYARISHDQMATDIRKESEMTQKQIEEAETFEALTALGYELIEGKMVKRLRDEDMDQEYDKFKRNKIDTIPDSIAGEKSSPVVAVKSFKSQFAGLVKLKPKLTADQKDQKLMPPPLHLLKKVTPDESLQNLVQFSPADSVAKTNSSMDNSIASTDNSNAISSSGSSATIPGLCAYSDSSSSDSD